MSRATTTAPATNIHMRDQAAAKTCDGRIVVVQLWEGFMRGRCALVTITDGYRTGIRSGTLPVMQRAFDIVQFGDATRLTDPEARTYLAAKDVHERRCDADGCTAVLPIGEQWCSDCGAVHNARQT